MYCILYCIHGRLKQADKNVYNFGIKVVYRITGFYCGYKYFRFYPEIGIFIFCNCNFYDFTLTPGIQLQSKTFLLRLHV